MVPLPVVTVPKGTALLPVWLKATLPVPVDRLVTATAVPRLLFSATLPLVLVALTLVAFRFSAVRSPMPVPAERLAVVPVTVPPPSMSPAELMVTLPVPALVVPVRGTLPAVAVVSAMLLLEPVATLLPTVRLAPVSVRAMVPLPVVTVVKVTAPLPVWLNVTVPVPVDRLVTATAVARLLFSTRLPLVLVAFTLVAFRFRAVRSPMPVRAVRLAVPPVTVPLPSMSPAELMVTVPVPAFVVPVRLTLPAVLVVSVTFWLLPLAP